LRLLSTLHQTWGWRETDGRGRLLPVRQTDLSLRNKSFKNLPRGVDCCEIHDWTL